MKRLIFVMDSQAGWRWRVEREKDGDGDGEGGGCILQRY